MFSQDKTAVRAFSGGRITETGFYPITITKAFDHDGAGEDNMSKSVHIGYVTDCGKSGDIYICYQNRQGEPMDSGTKRITGELMILTEVETLNAKQKMVPIYNFDLKTDVPTKKKVFEDLVGKHIGAVFQMKEEIKQTLVDGTWKDSKETRLVPNFICFASDTGQSAKEFMDDADAESIEKYVTGLAPIKYMVATQDAHIMQQATNQPTAPVKDAFATTEIASTFDDFEDDIPFN